MMIKYKRKRKLGKKQHNYCIESEVNSILQVNCPLNIFIIPKIKGIEFCIILSLLTLFIL